MGDVRLKRDTRERLGEKIGSVYDSRSVVDNKILGFNVRTDEVIADVYVLGLAMVGIIN